MFPSIHDESQYRISTIRYILIVSLILSHRSRRYSMLHPSYHALPPHLMTYLHPRYIPLDTISGNSPHIISSLYLSITYPHPPPPLHHTLSDIRLCGMTEDTRIPHSIFPSYIIPKNPLYPSRHHTLTQIPEIHLPPPHYMTSSSSHILLPHSIFTFYDISPLYL